MATLRDKRQRLSVQIQPVPPSMAGPQNAYDVAILEGAQIVFERQYTIYEDSPDGHWYVWRLFRALQMTETLAVTETPYDLTGSHDGLFHEPAMLSVDLGWLHMVLSADTITHSRPTPLIEHRSNVVVYLLTSAQEMGGYTGQYQQFGLECVPADVVAFGRTLEAECREALRQRRSLGITAPADAYIDD